MPKFKYEVALEAYEVYEVEADSLRDAYDKAMNDEGMLVTTRELPGEFMSVWEVEDD